MKKHYLPIELGKACHQGGAIIGFEFLEFTAVKHTCNQFSHINLLLAVLGHHIIELFDIIQRGFNTLIELNGFLIQLSLKFTFSITLRAM